MKAYLDLWVQGFSGLLALIMAILTPFLFILFEILPYGVICLLTGIRLKDEYKYLYFLPTFIKVLTKPLRNRTRTD